MLVPVKVRILWVLALIGLLAGSMVGFQNCARMTTTSAPTSQIQFSGNGGPYEGKVFVSSETCIDSSPAVRVYVFTAQSAQVLRENCQDVIPPRMIGTGDFSIAPSRTEIVYKGETLFPEIQTILNKQSAGTGLVENSPVFAELNVRPLEQGSLMVCTVFVYEFDDQNSPAITVSDDRGNLYRPAISLRSFPNLLANSTSQQYGVYYAENVTAGASTVRVDFGMTLTGADINCAEYAGIAPSGALGATSFNSGPTPDNISIGPVAANANDLILGVTFSYGWLAPGSAVNFAHQGTMHSLTISDRVVPVAGDNSFTYGPSGGFNEWWFGHQIVFRGR